MLITNESSERGGYASSGLNVLVFLFDNVISLRYIEDEAPDIGRAISIVKMRNSNHAKTLNRVTIGESGIVVENTIVGASGRLGWTVLKSESSSHGASYVRQTLGHISCYPIWRARNGCA